MARARGGRGRAIVPTHPISDSSKLLWERYFGPMQAAAAQFNAAVQNTEALLARVIIEREGLDPETHAFDMDRRVIVPRAPATPQVMDISGG